MIYFTLTDTLHAARYEKSIILLDVKNDNYLSLIEDAADYLILITQNSFIQNPDGLYQLVQENIACDNTQLNKWIQDFTANNFIQTTTNSKRKRIASEPLQAGGLREYQWDTQTNWKPFSKTKFIDIMRSLIVLRKVHKQINKKKLEVLFNLVEKYKLTKPAVTPTQQEIEKLSAAIDAATILYPKKSYCLAWATAFTIMALKKGWPSSLVIGVQMNPFYAHAWSEINNQVIHDDAQVSQVLAIIARYPQEKN